MSRIGAIWTENKRIARFSFLFRVPAFIFLITTLIIHLQVKGIALGAYHYAIFSFILFLPFLYLYDYHRRGSIQLLYQRHSMYDLFVIGWTIGLFQLSIIPCFYAALAAFSNHVSIRGFKSMHILILIPLGAIISLWVEGMVIDFSSSTPVTVISLVYTVIHFSILAYISNYYLNRYFNFNKKLKVQSEEIHKQKEEIHRQAQELTLLNSKLEKKVVEQTGVVKSKEKKLQEYAFINAHKLRAPLARILGLVQLFEHPELNEGEESKMVEMLKDSADELDSIVSDINKGLEK